MKLTREEALKYHRQMWSDMQRELGDYPKAAERIKTVDKDTLLIFDDGTKGWCYSQNPVAWMELPEGWKGELHES